MYNLCVVYNVELYIDILCMVIYHVACHLIYLIPPSRRLIIELQAHRSVIVIDVWTLDKIANRDRCCNLTGKENVAKIEVC